MQKVSEAMPALIEEAFAEAREQSFRAWQAHQPITSEKRALEAAQAQDRVLITAYLSHPAVLREVAQSMPYIDPDTAWPGDREEGATDILQAIGARKP
jgi:Fe-S cluster biosynthesis and repair protein YggX